MVDIKRVDGAFLNSESRLANAMLEVVNEAELTLLSYHCHGLVPMGVSCVGVLLQNYMSFHTWPQKGVITLDLCVGGKTELLPVLSIIERHFGVPQTGRTLVEKPEMRWAHKVRGFVEDEELLASTDLGLYVVNDLKHDVNKEEVSLICLSLVVA
jgi:S-adenosylmethionine/arginine decarboxylase-like enzyme